MDDPRPARNARPPSRGALGASGEDLAARYLVARGYRVVARNWRPGGGELRGELDLVVARGDVLAFVEVKTRRSEAFGGPLVAVTRSKQARIRGLATAFLRRTGASARQVRFDVIGVLVAPGRAPVVQHVPGAF